MGLKTLYSHKPRFLQELPFTLSKDMRGNLRFAVVSLNEISDLDPSFFHRVDSGGSRGVERCMGKVSRALGRLFLD